MNPAAALALLPVAVQRPGELRADSSDLPQLQVPAGTTPTGRKRTFSTVQLSQCRLSGGEQKFDFLVSLERLPIPDRTTEPLTLSLLYLSFHLTLSVSKRMGRWGCVAACRRQRSGADEFVSLWRWILSTRARSQNRSLLCPKLEPLIERPNKASSHLQV